MHGSFLGQTRISKSWLFTPPLHGAWAVVVSLAAVAIPTLIRLNMFPMGDQACTVFCPFVLATSILCGWQYAIAVAVGGAISCDTILMGSPYTFHFQRSDLEGLPIFLGYSAFSILFVCLFRMTAARSLRQADSQERASGIVFSLEDGEAWASWYGVDASVRLGSPDEVVPMMEDFLAQVELGKRLQTSLGTQGRAPG